MDPVTEEASGDRPDLRLVPGALAAWLTVLLVPGAPAPLVLGVCVLALATGFVLALRGSRTAQRAGRADARSERSWSAAAAGALVCAVGAAASVHLHDASADRGPVAGLARAGAAVVVEIVVTADPRAAAPRPGRPALLVVQARVERVQSAGRTTAVRTPVVVLATDVGWRELLPSQRVRAEGRLAPAREGDTARGVLSARGPPVLLDAPSGLQRAAGHLRAGLRRAVEPLPADARGLLPGLVVGDVSRLDPTLRDDFRTTGLSHLTAVSGTNVAIVLSAVLLLVRRLGAGLRLSALLAGLALVGFVVLARPSPSVLRAAVMGGVGVLALVVGRQRRAVPALAVAVLLLVLLDPGLGREPGFALSVLATGGLLVLAPGWRDRLAVRMPRALAEALVVPLAATVAVAPVVAALSSEVSLVSVPANLLAAPAVGPATVLGVLVAVAAPVALPIAHGLAWLAALPVLWLAAVARHGAGLPAAAVPWPGGGLGAGLVLLLTAAVAVLARREIPRRVLAAGLVGALAAGAVVQLAGSGWPPRGWRLVACGSFSSEKCVLQ